ncbi:hypothetical protein FRC03_001227 [Tulasnella sp. 419]|nr:hypothetical protein FRC03_001227 [Tulasnella sp. 419]
MGWFWRMSQRTSSSRPSLDAESPTGPHQNSSSVTSLTPVDAQPGPSNVHPPSTSQSIPKSTGLPNDDEEKQLSGADQPVEGEGDPSQKPPGLPQGDQKATGGNDPSAPPDPDKTGPSSLDQYADFWGVYNKEADKEDNELIKSFAGDLDTLLIFAGLFSATNTAFIVESYKDLKQDPSELTNNLLRNMMRTIHQSSFTEADLLLDYGGPPTRAIVVNLFFFASLCCSLFTAFGAVIGKQWLNHYGRENQLSSPSARGIERQRKHMGLEKWKFQAVVETLPTLLQFSLFFFFIGLIDFMWPLNIAVGILILLLSVLTLLFYVVTLLIGILDPNSPFQTRLTNVLRKRFTPKKPALVQGQDTKMDILRARCVDWLQQRTTFSETIGIISRAITLLTDDAKKAINLDSAGAILAYLLRSLEYNGRVYLGVSAEGLQSSLIPLRDAISQWDKDSDKVHIEDTRNVSSLVALNTELYNLLLGAGTMDEIETSTALAILGKLGPRSWGGSRDSRATYLIKSLGKPLTRQDQLVHLALLTDALWPDVGLRMFNGVDAYVTNIHMREVLSTTMWGVDGKPDLDHRRVLLRLNWFCKDTDGMYPQIQDLDFGRYLSLWLKSDVQPDRSIPFEGVRGWWYSRTVIQLLLHDQERWAKELDEHGHLTHIEAISQDIFLQNAQLLAFIMFAFVAGRNDDPNAPPSQYYSQARVDRVVQQLRDVDLYWIRRSVSNLQPNHVDSINQSLSGYIQTAYQYKRITDDEFDKASQGAKVMMDCIRIYLESRH